MKFIYIISLALLGLGTLQAQENSIDTSQFTVNGMCGMCQERIETTALKKGKAKTAEWNMESKVLTVTYKTSKTNADKIQKAIASVGHDTEDYKAADEVYNGLHGCCKYRDAESSSSSAEVDTGQIVESFYVAGICGMCEERIETAALALEGVETADWDVETQTLKVELDLAKNSLEEVHIAVARAGHDTKMYLATDEAYDNLHGCCKYRDPEVVKDHGIDHEESEHSHGEPSETTAATNTITGYVYGEENGNAEPLFGANVYVPNTSIGSTTDENGFFQLDIGDEKVDEVEVSYIGFSPKTIKVRKNKDLDVTLMIGTELQEVEIKYRKKTTAVSFVKPLNVETVSEEELTKAACCNLSESFETNPSVDVSYNDAVTGTKQIQMLGLAGPNVQIQKELIPDVRAMSSAYGLNMTPGPWVESIQLVKGIGSVVNGFESVTGQINVELRKPDRGPKLFLNGYVNAGSRVELNAFSRHQVSDAVSTAFLLHGKRLQSAQDRNEDGFTDMPLEEDFVVSNRWKFRGEGNLMGQVGVKVSALNHEAGSIEHFNKPHEDDHWVMNNDTRRYELWGKMGYIFPSDPGKSLGFQSSIVYQDQDGFFGRTMYNSEQRSLWANLIFQTIIDPQQTFKAGASYQYDDIDEYVTGPGQFSRNESVPGVFAEYTYESTSGWTFIPGLRADYHNNYGAFLTPRLHAKYNFSDRSIIRFVGGRGLRTASIFAENLGAFASSRQMIVRSENSENPYGLDPEIAWNYGVNLTHGFDVAGREMTLSLDAYRTDFENQIIVDYENPREVTFSNLDGRSFSNSFQVKTDYELFNNMDVRLAYRLFDVKSDLQTGLLPQAYIAKHRAFVNAAYTTESDWSFDATLNWIGPQRLPSTQANPEQFRFPEESEDYFLLNAQVMKQWGSKWDLYLGVENALNFQQTNAIIDADNPFGEFFDASIVWAPLFGTNVYAGFRYRLGAE